MACQSLPLEPYARDLDEPITLVPTPPSERLLRASVWRGLITLPCPCTPAEAVVEKGWVRCANAKCRAAGEILPAVAHLASTLEASLAFALAISSGGESGGDS